MTRLDDYISAEQLDRLRKLARSVELHRREHLELKEEFDELATAIAEAGPPGTLTAMATELQVSREWLRRTGRRYYRSVIRRTKDGRMLISMPADNVTAERDYEIRDKASPPNVLAVVKGRSLLDARQEQLEAYLEGGEHLTNISVVDVSHLIESTQHPTVAPGTEPEV